MAGAYFAYRNFFTETEYVVTAGIDTTEVPEFPFTNLYTRQLSEVSRFYNLSGDVSIEINALGSGFECNLIAFMGENPPNEIQVNGLTTYTQSYSESDEMDAVLPRITIFCIPLTVITSIITTHPGVGEGELARIFRANAIYLPKGVDARWGLGLDDSGSLQDSDGKQFYENRGVRLRRLKFNCTVLTDSFAYDFVAGSSGVQYNPCFQAMQYYAGKTGEVVIVPRSGTALDIKRMAIYGHLENTFEITHDSGQYYSVSLSALEER